MGDTVIVAGEVVGAMCYECQNAHFVPNQNIEGECTFEIGDHWWCQEDRALHVFYGCDDQYDNEIFLETWMP